MDDWSLWLDAHFLSLRETFDKHKREGEALPAEFVDLDSTRIHFAVIAGRRRDFKPSTYRNRRQSFAKNNVLILHYDNLVDAARGLIGSATY